MKKLLLFLLLAASPLWSSYVDGKCTANSTSCTLTAYGPYTTGSFSTTDLEIAIGYASATTTPPTPPSGWSSVTTWATPASGTQGAFTLACRKSDGTTGSGTWTGANSIAVVSIKGTVDPTTCTSAFLFSSGQFAQASSTLSFPSLTMSGSGWVIGLAASSSTVCIPTGFSSFGASLSVSEFWNTGELSSFAGASCSIASGTWGAITVEPLNGIPSFVTTGTSLTASASPPKETTNITNATCANSTCATVGDYLFVFPATPNNAISSCTDDASTPNTYTIATSQVNPGGTHPMYVAVAYTKVVNQPSNITCNYTTDPTGNAEQIVGQYTSVAAIGNNTTATSGSVAGTNPSLSINTQDSNNIVLAGFVARNGPTYTAQNGTIRKQLSTGNSVVGEAIIENSSASPASVTDSATISNQQWSGVGIELRSTTGVVNRLKFRSFVF